MIFPDGTDTGGCCKLQAVGRIRESVIVGNRIFGGDGASESPWGWPMADTAALAGRAAPQLSPEQIAWLGKNLTKLRGILSRPELAKRAGIAQGTLKSWENGLIGERITAVKALEKLAKFFSVTVDQLLSPECPASNHPGEPQDEPTIRLAPTALEQEFLNLALKGLRGERRVLLQEVITVAAEAAP